MEGWSLSTHVQFVRVMGVRNNKYAQCLQSKEVNKQERTLPVSQNNHTLTVLLNAQRLKFLSWK